MRILLVLLTILSTLVAADDSFRWIDGRGNTLPESESRKSQSGFGGWLLITPDSDWQEKWATLAEVIPYFTVTEQVTKGNEIFILVLFSNPLPDNGGLIDIGCDIKVTRPDGSISVDYSNLDCARGELLGDRYATRMTNLGITYIAEEDDLSGQWEVLVKVTDRVRKAQVSLEANFVVLE